MSDRDHGAFTVIPTLVVGLAASHLFAPPRPRPRPWPPRSRQPPCPPAGEGRRANGPVSRTVDTTTAGSLALEDEGPAVAPRAKALAASALGPTQVSVFGSIRIVSPRNRVGALASTPWTSRWASMMASCSAASSLVSMTSRTAQSRWHLNLWDPSLNEALLLLPEGGAVASFGPAGITTPRQQRTLAHRVYSHFLGEGVTLGDAILWAKSESLAEDPDNTAAVDGWNLLGDPALRLTR